MGDRCEGITEALEGWRAQSPGALEELMPLVIQELRSLAKSHFRKEAPGHTLQPTALVNEVYLRFRRQVHVRLGSRAEFFAFSSKLMRRILVDHYRSRQTSKRGRGLATLALDEALETPSQGRVDLVELDDALRSLKELDHRKCRVVELRFFAGLTVPETSNLLGVSPATVKREWMLAKAWLQYTMNPC